MDNLTYAEQSFVRAVTLDRAVPLVRRVAAVRTPVADDLIASLRVEPTWLMRRLAGL